jgi:transposase InsO family protein
VLANVFPRQDCLPSEWEVMRRHNSRGSRGERQVRRHHRSPVRNRAWVCDMMSIPTRNGWQYLAVLIDLASPMVVGWATSASMATALPLRAFQYAIARRQPSAELLPHADRGSRGAPFVLWDN